MKFDQDVLKTALDDTLSHFEEVLENYQAQLALEEIGRVEYVGNDIVRVSGLPEVQADELVRFPGDILGLAFNLTPSEVGVILLNRGETLQAGDEVYRTGRVFDVPVGEALLGRIVDAAGRPLDEGGPIRTTDRRPIERDAPSVMDRAPVTMPLQTGLKVIDALIPIGRGQRELILGDRQTGKTAIALDAILNQKDKDVLCVYCAIGQRDSAVAKVIADLRERQALDYCLVVVATGKDPAGLQFVAPYAATSMAEYFMEQGRDVLIVYDDLTRHARAYRELSLLLRRPPGREAYPGDIFYIHSRLLERSTHLRWRYGGGSLTALPIIETQAQNISAYIPTNLISITDGQIYLSPQLFQKGVLPAVDVGRSVSRVGGKAQLSAYRAVAGDLRLTYSQFEELEAFARFGTQLDEETRQTLERGRRVREVLKQTQYDPIPVAEQIAVLLAVIEGIFDHLPLAQVSRVEEKVRQVFVEQAPDLYQRIQSGDALEDEERETVLKIVRRTISSTYNENENIESNETNANA
ncbi:MAG: alternate F1F0 ATPase, F1 subunit alpha [Anaerolineae bacterium]|nr:alternate F1F0 ATPase, F1 subunit alpha [Anaerolineae bacterium]